MPLKKITYIFFFYFCKINSLSFLGIFITGYCMRFESPQHPITMWVAYLFIYFLDQKYHYTHVLWSLFSLYCHWKMTQSLGRKLFKLQTVVFWNMLLVSSPANCLSYFSSEQMPVISTMSAMAVWTALTILRSEFPLIQTSLKWIPVMTDPAQVPGPPSFCLCSPSIISPPPRSRHNRTCPSLLQTP